VGEPVADESGVSKPIPHMAPAGEPVADESEVSKPIPYTAPMGETITHEAPIGTNAGSSAALLNREESEHFRTRWNEIQSKFVDEPRSAVQQADALVSEVVEQITQMFANEHSSLEGQWNQGNDVSTEDLRKALQRYRSFFNRLVA
jgi:GH25 family lysozyme M1 (1,4-beta-N-acetylmuramidase)